MHKITYFQLETEILFEELVKKLFAWLKNVQFDDIQTIVSFGIFDFREWNRTKCKTNMKKESRASTKAQTMQ